MRILVAVGDTIPEPFYTPEQQAELDALWDNPEDQRSFIAAAEAETVLIRKRVEARNV